VHAATVFAQQAVSELAYGNQLCKQQNGLEVRPKTELGSQQHKNIFGSLTASYIMGAVHRYWPLATATRLVRFTVCSEQRTAEKESVVATHLCHAAGLEIHSTHIRGT
jgi:hypothetical protein